MGFYDNAKIIRRDLLARISRILLSENAISNLDRIPIEMRPRNGEHVRCCIYRDRAVIKYKIMGMLGFSEEDEDDELMCLSEYFEKPKNNSPLLSVVSEACSACQKNSYVVTNMCRSCVARPCMVNCPKKAITVSKGSAVIDSDLCVKCGICLKACPFHAIIYTPVPCEESCPVKAINKNDTGKEKIDEKKCIQCGKCMEACPFGAIVEKTHLFDVIKAIKNNENLIAMVAPSIGGQFIDGPGKILSGIKALGFKEVYEVALGAEITTRIEAEEFREKIQAGESMTTSCCPSYVNYIHKHNPELNRYISSTLSPMIYAAREIKNQHPESKLVFVGPCLAKKDEAIKSNIIDFTINFEEFGAWLVGAGIELSLCNPVVLDANISFTARGFACSGGVSKAVENNLTDISIEKLVIDGIDKHFLRKLKPALQSTTPTLIEVMSCEGGCVGGCSILTNPKMAVKLLEKYSDPTVVQIEKIN